MKYSYNNGTKNSDSLIWKELPTKKGLFLKIYIFILRIYYRILNITFSFFLEPSKVKGRYELKFWRILRLRKGFYTHHYEHFYTIHFGFDKAFFNGKKILDIGCGPMGSLEWADMSSERIGLDTLADSYKEFGIDNQEMQYVNAGVEQIPFPDNYFDVVCSFNSLDHVDELEKAIKEIIRVTAQGGYFLLLSDLNHKPTSCEPASFSWDIVEKFRPYFKLVEEKHYEKSRQGIYDSILAGVLYNHDDKSLRHGYLSAKFLKL